MASLSDVFAATLPTGYSLADAPAAQRRSVRQPLQTADGAKVIRDIDLKVIKRAGRTIGSVFVFLLQPGQELQVPGIVQGYAESRSGSSLSGAAFGAKSVTLIKWMGSADVAYAASTFKILAIIDATNKTELDAVTPALISFIQ